MPRHDRDSDPWTIASHQPLSEIGNTSLIVYRLNNHWDVISKDSAALDRLLDPQLMLSLDSYFVTHDLIANKKPCIFEV